MINLKEIKQLSRLSKIKITDSEAEGLISKLTSVMSMISKLNEVDTEGVEPLTSVVNATLYRRPDVVTDGGLEKDLFANVPGKSAELAREIKCFVVPKVVE